MHNRRQFLGGIGSAAALSVATGAGSLGAIRKLRLSAFLPPTGNHDRLQPDWYRQKIKQVQDRMKENKLDAMVLLNATNGEEIQPPSTSTGLNAEEDIIRLLRNFSRDGTRSYVTTSNGRTAALQPSR